MKQSVFTGKYIYEELKQLEKEINELYDAAEMVKNEIGAGSVAYRLLNQQYKDKKTEFQLKEKANYYSAPQPSFDPFMADTPASRPF